MKQFNKNNNSALEGYTLSEWQEHFTKLYGHKDTYHSRYEILARLSEEIGELVDPISTLDRETLQYQIADIFVWLSSFASKVGLNIEELMLQKYHEKPPLPLYTAKTLEDFFSGTTKPITISDWQDRIEGLYGEINMRISPYGLIVNLFKDLGDLVKATRRHNNKLIESKTASLLAWTLAIASKFGIDLASVMAEKYEKCPVCGRVPCACRQIRNILVITDDNHSTENAIETLSKYNINSQTLIIGDNDDLGSFLITLKNYLECADAVIFDLSKISPLSRISISYILTYIPQPFISVLHKYHDDEYTIFFTDSVNKSGLKHESVKVYSSDSEVSKNIEMFIKKLLFEYNTWPLINTSTEE